MHVRSALLWETGGEPHRDEVLISDERSDDGGADLAIFDRFGRQRAASPEELPKGSVLLLPPTISDDELGRIQRSGYTARRSAVELEDGSVPLGATGAAPPSREAAIASAEAELHEVTERLKHELQRRHPELFDGRGRLRTSAYSRTLLGRTGGKQTLTREEISRLAKDWAEPKDKATAIDAP